MKPALGKAEKQVPIQTRRLCILIVLEYTMYDKQYINCAVSVKNATCRKPVVTRHIPGKLYWRLNRNNNNNNNNNNNYYYYYFKCCLRLNNREGSYSNKVLGLWLELEWLGLTGVVIETTSNYWYSYTALNGWKIIAYLTSYERHRSKSSSLLSLHCKDFNWKIFIY